MNNTLNINTFQSPFLEDKSINSHPSKEIVSMDSCSRISALGAGGLDFIGAAARLKSIITRTP